MLSAVGSPPTPWLDVCELGAGHGRDALYFAREGLTVQATDFSPVGLEQLRDAACAQGVEAWVTTAVHDVRERLPLPDDHRPGEAQPR